MSHQVNGFFTAFLPSRNIFIPGDKSAKTAQEI